MMIRTVSLKLKISDDETHKLSALQKAFASACNAIVPYVVERRCWNRVALHNLVYSNIRKASSLGSQMVCNAIYSVCKAYKSQSLLGKIEKDKPAKCIAFHRKSIHFDKRTYSFTSSNQLSLYTLSGRIKVDFVIGEYQRKLLAQGKAKEGELIYKNGQWYFNLALELPDISKVDGNVVMGVDVGENVVAATSTGKICGGKKLQDRRDRFLARRKRLQSNGSQSARQALRNASGKESRHVKHVNHETSKAIVNEAKAIGAHYIALEDLTHIRGNIKGNKRIRTRLHRWPFRQLQEMITYKARGCGLEVVYVNPAYSSQTCSHCFRLGERKKHQFRCNRCGFRAHADCNASRILAWIVISADVTRAEVNRPNVGAL